MRNLILASARTISLPLNAHITSTALDLDQNALYAASEKVSVDGEVEVEIYRIGEDETVDQPAIYTMFSSIASGSRSASQVVSLRVIPDSRKLVAVMRGGDITTMPLDEEAAMAQVEGSVDQGFLAASWSPDESLLALITGDAKLILMTSEFDVLSEGPMETTDFGKDAPINVGWGSKQTQFHGSLGKAAAQASTNVAVGSSPDDDTLPRISWRGDGAYFVVSTTTQNSTLAHRVLRVYDRQGVLQSTSEGVPGLEHTLSWRPSGNLIAGTQRFGFEGGGAGRAGRHDLVFFERNGLRHGEFELRPKDMGIIQQEKFKWGYRVKEVGWSSDSNVLTVWIEREEGDDLVQLWTTGNYHWYLKQEIAGHFTSVTWHPENAMELILTTSSSITRRTYGYETNASNSPPPKDSALVGVFDGSSILLTPFRTQNVPPPMSSLQLSLADVVLPHGSRIPIHLSFSAHSNTLGVLWETGYIELWALNTRLGPGRGKVMEPKRSFALHVKGSESVLEYRQIVLLDDQEYPEKPIYAALLGVGTSGSDHVVIVKCDGESRFSSIPLGGRDGRLVSNGGVLVWQSTNGELEKVEFKDETTTPIGRFSEFCFTAQLASVSDNKLLLMGLTDSGQLHITVNTKNADPTTSTSRIIASNATSFCIASGHLIFTTGAHESIFAPLSDLPELLAKDDEGNLLVKEVPLSNWEKRRVERGSRIVVPVPSNMSLVLQMPRGNLETINPRPLVLEVVRQDLNSGQYRKAFMSCRKHRVDLNFLVDHDQVAFLKGLSSFVEQVNEVDHINLLLTSVGRGTQPPATINRLCDSLREELEKKDLKGYVNSILTAHVVKTPPDHEAGLSFLLRIRDADPSLVEDAVKYIIFLIDADKLFDAALGMYDFSLVLMIAQHAQRDPREYLPFLRELRALDTYYQRFRIDDHLRRYANALKNLSLAGPSRFDEAIEYAERHQLYGVALKIWKDTDKYPRVLEVYGDWLYERREFRNAAAVFVQAGHLQKAMVAHEKALEWQELFDLAVRTQVSAEDLEAMAYRVSEDLVSKKRFAEAAKVLLDYANDIRTAVINLVQGNELSEARRIVALKKKPELLDEVIYPGALESRAQIAEDVTEMREQLRKQLNRIRELRIKKVEEPDEFYGVEDTALHNVDVMTDISMAPTAFTRYTIAPSTASRTSKKSSRSKRKAERKVGSGRKGTVDEEEYLLKSVTKLSGRFSASRDEAGKLLPHLLQFTPEHRDEGMAMQEDVAQLEQELKTAIDEIWTKTPVVEGQDQEPVVPAQDSWAARMEEVERNRRINPAERVPKPDILSADWKLKLYEIEM
ncbi:pol ii transcription elongation factor [Moniliophthora roreri MCA 2997]|uniref:Elongator complex protein 1 n=1 Tax=Moniliophthora roreri (strain MCA 2997) TaxID=1381753 RepID=V2X213_MONRO|nr:pol ii transcription elongation factor [Moniliophthora roreri MCA 2997]